MNAVGPRCLICGHATAWRAGDYECVNADCKAFWLNPGSVTSEELHVDQKEEPVGHIHWKHGDDFDWTGEKLTDEQREYVDRLVKEINQGLDPFGVPPDAEQIIDKAVEAYKKFVRRVFVAGVVTGIVGAKIVSKFNKKGQR
jgi:hypothetical protein